MPSPPIESAPTTRPRVWAKNVSPNPVRWEDADGHCRSLGPGFRLPSKRELRLLLVDPDAEKPAFRPDVPSLPENGWLWSGDTVTPKRARQPWAMDATDGAFWNAGDMVTQGRPGYALCLRGDDVPAERPAGPYDATLGPPTAKLSIVVAAEHDVYWMKARPIVLRLVERHSVRTVWKHWPVFHRPVALALCAAARQQKFAAFEGKLASDVGRAQLDAAALRERAIAVGIDAAVYATDVAGACKTILELDREELEERSVEATPTFFIGRRRIEGVQSEATFDAAVVEALGQ
jgi:hypothetical protein